MRRRFFISTTGIALLALLAAACGGKIEGGNTGHSSSGVGSGGSGSSSSNSGSSTGSSSSSPSSGSSSSPSGSSSTGSGPQCTGGGGGGGVAGGACSQVEEFAQRGSTNYSVQCTCPSLDCTCIVNGAVVDTVESSSCVSSSCPPPDDAWKACGFPPMP